MNPMFQKLYKHKKTRVRDPNLPPAPTLLGQVKELKDTRTALDNTAIRLQAMENRIAHLEAKNRYLEQYVETLRGHLAKISKH